MSKTKKQKYTQLTLDDALAESEAVTVKERVRTERNSRARSMKDLARENVDKEIAQKIERRAAQ